MSASEHSTETSLIWNPEIIRQFLVGGGILAGIAGLVIAGRTLASVEDLKINRPAVAARLTELEKSVSRLDATVNTYHKADTRRQDEIAELLRSILEKE